MRRFSRIDRRFTVPSGSHSILMPPTLGSPLWGYRGDKFVPGTTATWTDQSGGAAGNASSQSVVISTHPTLNASDAAFNNRPTLGFAAANAQSLLTGTFTAAQPWSIFAVLKQITTGTLRVVAGCTGNTIELYGDASGLWSMFGGTVVASANNSAGPLVLCATFNGAGSALYINNSATNLISGNPGSTGLSAGAVTIGAAAAVNNFFNGTMADNWAYGIVPTLAQRQAWFAYAATRYAQAWS